MKRLLLIGAGHAHAQVLRDWVAQPVAGVELVLVSPTALAPYSGMVPGWLAGRYAFDDICIYVTTLAAAAGARWVQDEMVSLDAGRRTVALASGAVLVFDLLSLNIGSTLSPPASAVADADSSGAAMLSLRPLGRLHAAWDLQLAALARQASGTPFSVTAIGGGAAGFESLLAVLARLRALWPGRPVRGLLVSRASSLLPGLAPGAVRAAAQALARAGVTSQLGTAWHEGQHQRGGLLLWATGAEAHAWQRDAARRGGLAVSAPGFIHVDAQLRSCSQPSVYAVGDCAEWAPPLPKAGVFAVRMGPVLSHNLRAALGDGKAGVYRPQQQFLALLATGDGRAIGSRGRWSAQGRWLWRWKDHIDRQFLRRFVLAAPAAPGLLVGMAALLCAVPGPLRAEGVAVGSAVPAALVPSDWPGHATHDAGSAWRLVTLPAQTKPVTQFRLEGSGGHMALRLDANASYGNLLLPLAASPAPARLRWSWRVTTASPGIDLRSRSGDDSPAKVCLSFDWPDARVPFFERQVLNIARARSGTPLPAATLCWLWGGPDAAVGDLVENPFTRRVRSITLRTTGQVGTEWFSEVRDVAQDLRRAFGDELAPGEPLPRAIGLLVGADSDNTRSHSVAWISGLRLD